MNHRIVVNGLRVFWIVITVWYELGVFFSSVRRCTWPDTAFSEVSDSPFQRDDAPFHVLLIADPQILDHRSYPERGPYLTYLTRLVVDLNLRKNWRAALRKKPDAVIFLGDMMDGGRFDMSEDEYERYYSRFKSIFRLPLNIPVHFIPGNHDIGLRALSSSFSPDAHARYTEHFGQLNGRFAIANHTLVFIDAPSLVEEDNERLNHAKTYRDWVPRRGGTVEHVKSIAKERSGHPHVLLSHIPLARDTYHCGPLREKGTIRPGMGFGYQNTLGKEVTHFLLKELQPSVIFSGDDHDYCETTHPFSVNGISTWAREVSVKSLSMAMGIKRPGFQLLSLYPQRLMNAAPQTYADVPCLLPDQISIYLSAYVPLLLVSLLAVLVSSALRVRSGPTSERQRSRRHSTPSGRRQALRRRKTGESSEDEALSDHSFALLPQPASTSKRTRYQPHTFVIFGRRRQMPHTLGPITGCIGRLTMRQKPRGLWGGFVGDAIDVAVYPLTLFVVISLWISFT
ncbi:hypothetical protein DXG03_003165 [Asterophora parasitica]|uniref:Calcineurin-like phosphoesterase domain-containing protein n=1 Tax=Asterophora parasitica TaxID=117018 RepID=A0A9P7KGE5_9AGAR|nr:hypothetical protein DXG03_003165 [Asterophora parasitica]